MRKFKFLAVAAIAAATTVMTSCSKDDEAVNNPADGKLTFASQVSNDPQGRATSTGTFDQNDQVSIYLEKVGDPGVNGTYTFVADGKPEATFSTTADLYWNDFASGINATAWYPKDNTYTYQTDQSNGIQASDFLFATKVEGITRSNWKNDDKKLTFKHKTAKVTIKLESGTGSPDIDDAAVRINGYESVKSIKKTGINADGTIVPNNNRGWITPDASNTALLLPGQLTEKIFKVTLTNGQEYYYNGSYNFEAEKAYTFTVTVNKTGLTVKGSIADWGSGGTPSGSAE